MLKLFKKWDCIKHKWVWFFIPYHTPFHNTWFYKFYTKDGKPDCSKWGQIWLVWLKFPIKYYEQTTKNK